jgi:hypothetical protein
MSTISETDHIFQKIVDGELVMTMAITSDELDKLATKSRIGQWMLQMIKDINVGDCPYCRMERHGGKHDDSVECGKLLAEIAELEKQG